SGAMPFGQCHYPFENKEWFETNFPADFIVEYPGQIRGWFYYLHVLSGAIMDKISFKNCLVHGTLLAADGSKISKSKRNFTDPMLLIDTYGADAMRIYLLSSTAVVMDDMNFKDEGVVEQIKNVLLPIWNSYSFFVTYANIDGYQGDPDAWPYPKGQLDRWILAELYNTEKKISEAYSSFYLNHSLNPALEFINNLTNWFIRRSRTRFWAEGMEQDKKDAYDTLYCVLVNLLKLLAPAAPFLTETVFKNITGRESIHLQSWPNVPEHYQDSALIEKVSVTRTVSSLGLALRQNAAIKVRQPLARARVALPPALADAIDEEQINVISNELNVKNIELLTDPGLLAEVVVRPDPRILGPKLGKDVQAVIVAAKQGQVRIEDEYICVFDKYGREWQLDKDDIDILYQGKDGLDVMSERGIVVSLDTNITDELREEGVANELNRAIQELRKKAGYNVSDRILLQIEGDLSEKWQNHLAENALAELCRINSEPDAETSVVVNDRTFAIQIVKVT
ncbi:MAG: class I tRNA ligase family protein, partial [Lentisphaerae bacterium]|nr:class I tRNA ligase family protein [Lentisphaerota bacterium]